MRKEIVALLSILTLSLSACGSTETTSTTSEATSEVISTQSTESETITDTAVYEDTEAQILDADFSISEDGDSTIRVHFKYTNNQSDPLYMYESFAVHAYQNDTELTDITDVNEEADTGDSANLIAEVYNGTSIDGSYVFELSNDSSVTVKVFTPTADEELLAEKTFIK